MGPANELLDRFEGEPRGDLAREVPAHAIGHGVQAERLRADEPVLVSVSDEARMGDPVSVEHVGSESGVYYKAQPVRI